MNKQELIKAVNKESHDWVNRKSVISLIEQLDEPEKVAIPKFVAEWYEEHKDSLEVSIFDYVYRINKKEESVFKKWFVESTTRPFQILVNMHQFGYTVEEEKRYRVRVKGICGNHETLNREKHSNKWLFSDREENSLYGTHHTRKQLEEAGFGWVFDCEGVEIEEVEE